MTITSNPNTVRDNKISDPENIQQNITGNFYSQTGNDNSRNKNNNNLNSNQNLSSNKLPSNPSELYSSNNFNQTAKSKQSNHKLNARASVSSKINLFNLMTTTPVRGRSIVDNFDVLKKKEKPNPNLNPNNNQNNNENNNLNNFNSQNSNNKNKNTAGIVQEDFHLASPVNLNFTSGELNQLNQYNPENYFNSQEGNTTNDKKNTFVRKVYNIEVATKNIFVYDATTKSLSKKELDLSNSPIKRFEAYHSTLNYNNKFYLSGGYGAAAKYFYEVNVEKENVAEKNEVNCSIKKLKDMPNAHSYHTLIGLKNYIFAVSGFNSKKCDKYFIDNDSWSSLPDLSLARSWPSVVNHEDKFIFVFGGIKDNDREKKGNKTFEKMDLNKGASSQWEILEVKIEEDFPFYFGILNLSQDLIFLGGKFSKDGENSEKCYKFNLSSDTNLEDTSKGLQVFSLSSSELTLPYKDTFDGRNFLALDEERKVFGQFSAIFSNRFYVFYTETNTIKHVEYRD